jgi:CBS domain-containing protein
MSIARICTREVHVASPHESVQEAATRMQERNVGSLVVLNDSGQPVGIVTDRDLVVRALANGLDAARTRIEDVMTVNPKTVTESTPVEGAISVMRTRHVRRLPVVDAEGKLAGLLSADDVMGFLAQELGDVGELVESQSVEHREMPRVW